MKKLNNLQEIFEALLKDEKISAKRWHDRYWIKLNCYNLIDVDGRFFNLQDFNWKNEKFYIWEPKKEKKKYWLWRVSVGNKAWYICNKYMDENLVDTNGDKPFLDHVIQKEKIENSEIEV